MGPGNHGLSSADCQHAKAMRPPGRRWRRMFANAATGSAKNMTPNWLITASNGAPGMSSTCASPTTKRTFGTPASAARLVARFASGAERSNPTTPPDGATAFAASMAANPPPQPMSSTRSPGCNASRSSNGRVTQVVMRSRFGQSFAWFSSFHCSRCCWLTAPIYRAPKRYVRSERAATWAAPTAFECYAKLGFGSAPEGLVAGPNDGVDVGSALALDEVTHRGFACLARA